MRKSIQSPQSPNLVIQVGRQTLIKQFAQHTEISALKEKE